MASLSIKFPAHASLNFRNGIGCSRIQATPPQPVAVPSNAGVEVDSGRLEPRVEEKDGYFVLKEKFRQGINPQEKIKIEKEPMDLFMKNGIEGLAKIPLEEIEKLKISKDDIDVRLKWLGLFHRRKHHCKSQSSLFFLLSIFFMNFIITIF